MTRKLMTAKVYVLKVSPPLFGPSGAKFNENKKNGSVSFLVSLISIDLQKKINSVIRFPSKLVTHGRTHGRTTLIP